MKKYVIIVAIAVAHSVITKIISSITLSIASAHVHAGQLPSMGRLFMVVSKVLYFPVITLAWYPRQFFPGNFVVIPLFINSLLWALVIYIFVVLFKRIFASSCMFLSTAPPLLPPDGISSIRDGSIR